MPYAERLRRDAGIMTMAVGLIVHAEPEAEQILGGGRPDRPGPQVALQSQLADGRRAEARGSTNSSARCRRRRPYWLAKRAQSVKSVVPSTFAKGMNVG